MKKAQGSPIVFCLMLLSLGGCAEFTHEYSQEQLPIHDRIVRPQTIHDLAGRWEYSDKTGSYPITLNTQGTGSYEWEEGWFETHSLENRTWTGAWVQKGNDREGGFELTFSDDPLVAQGEWWYTRIEKDHDPLQPGGTFKMSRSSTLKAVP